MNGAHVAMKHLRSSTGRGGQGANAFHLPWILTALVADGDSEASRKPLQTARAMNEILIITAGLASGGLCSWRVERRCTTRKGMNMRAVMVRL